MFEFLYFIKVFLKSKAKTKYCFDLTIIFLKALKSKVVYISFGVTNDLLRLPVYLQTGFYKRCKFPLRG